MEQGSVWPLTEWDNFYVIVGSSAGALTGLQFVVMTLISEARTTGSMREIRAFGSPTVVHFCAALLIAATMTGPWHAARSLGTCLLLYGAAGLAYSLRVMFHARKTEYRPDAEDWFWYGVLPTLTYAALTVAGVLVWSNAELALAIAAAVSLAFLFIGIHNSWDTVTYVALQRFQKQRSE